MTVTDLHARASKDAAEPRVRELPADAPDPQCVETPTHKRILAACAHAHEGALALVYGAAGVGKSTALAGYAAKHWDTEHKAHYVNMHGVRTPAGMLQTIAEGMRAPCANGAYRNVALMRELVYYLGPSSVLLLDEAQSLRPDALDMVRYFLDESGVGLVIAGNELVFSAITGKNQRAHFAQLHSRVSMKVYLPHATEADANAVLTAWGVADKEGRKYGRQIALGVGGLRGLCRILRTARKSAIVERRQIDHELMHATMVALGLDE